jgi:hypothetical protein
MPNMRKYATVLGGGGEQKVGQKIEVKINCKKICSKKIDLQKLKNWQSHNCITLNTIRVETILQNLCVTIITCTKRPSRSLCL